MRVLRAADHVVMPWKNGGGVTTEIAISPPGAALASFDWRISMATVASDGPFSRFDGIDRTLAILDGAGIALTIGDAAPVTLTPASAPCAFAGDLATSARLIAGPITDLNVMTRRGRWRHAVTRHVLGDRELAVAAGAIVLVADGELTADGIALASRDALVVDAPAALRGTATLYVIELATASS